MDDFTVYETKVKPAGRCLINALSPPRDWDPYQEITEKLKANRNEIILSGSIKNPQYQALNLYHYVNDYYKSCMDKYADVNYSWFSDNIEDDIIEHIHSYIDDNPQIIDDWLLASYDEIISAVRCIEDMPRSYVEREGNRVRDTPYVEPHLRDYPSQIVYILGRKHIWKFVELWQTTCNKLKFLGVDTDEYKKESARLFIKTSMGKNFIWRWYNIKYHDHLDYKIDVMWHHRDVDSYIQDSL